MLFETLIATEEIVEIAETVNVLLDTDIDMEAAIEL
jgi:hypothetical protein